MLNIGLTLPLKRQVQPRLDTYPNIIIWQNYKLLMISTNLTRYFTKICQRLRFFTQSYTLDSSNGTPNLKVSNILPLQSLRSTGMVERRLLYSWTLLHCKDLVYETDGTQPIGQGAAPGSWICCPGRCRCETTLGSASRSWTNCRHGTRGKSPKLVP